MKQNSKIDGEDAVGKAMWHNIIYDLSAHMVINNNTSTLWHELGYTDFEVLKYI